MFMNLTSLLQLAGLMHAGLLWAGTTMLFKVNLRIYVWAAWKGGAL